MVLELRHLRYFVAVAEEGSLTLAAQRRLHTAQPSLSRQVRDLEQEVGTALLIRSASGVVLTAAGTAFLDHARQALAQADMAVQAARRAAIPAKPRFALGFLTGQELEWLPRAMALIRDELPAVDVTVSSDTSPALAAGLVSGVLDIAFMRPEPNLPGLVYRVILTEKLIVVLPAAHRLAARRSIAIGDLANEMFIDMSRTAPTLRAIVDAYLRESGVPLRREHEIDNLGAAMSLVGSTGGVTLMPAYARRFLPRLIVSRPIAGIAPTIDLVIASNPANTSGLRDRFLARADRIAPQPSR